MQIKRKLHVLVRALLGLYLVGNVTYFFSKWLLVDILSLNPLHGTLGASVMKSLLDLAAIRIIFGRPFINALAGPSTPLRAAGLGALLAAGLVIAMLMGSALGYTQWNEHHMRGIQWTYLLGFSWSAAVSEELTCRYLILDQLGQVVGRLVGFALQIAVFLYLHMFGARLDGLLTLHLALGAVFLGAFYMWSGSLVGVMVLHFTFDILVTVFFGGTLDDLAIPPIVTGDSFSVRYSFQGAAAFMVVISITLLWWARRPRPSASSTSCPPKTS